MDKKLDQIVADIYALEPELKGRDAEVRILIRKLMDARPNVAPDPSFIAHLRAEVLAKVPLQKAPAPSHDLSWWAFHLAPIGVIAVLAFALVGEYRGSYNLPTEGPIPSRPMDPVSTGEMVAPPYEGGNVNGGVMRKSESMTYEGQAGDDSVSSDSMLMVDSDETSIAQTYIGGVDQAPRDSVRVDLLLQEPAHVRVFLYEDGGPRAVLGTSGVIAAGTHYDLAVGLSRKSAPGEVIYAQVFLSDGDPMFEPYEDEPARDEDGNLIYTTFMIIK